MEKNLKYIREVAQEREVENCEFRTFLKNLDMSSEELDSIVHEILEEVVSEIDCTSCANCCKQVKPYLDQKDVSVLSSGLKISEEQFQEKYLSHVEDDDGDYIFNALPCPFLENNKCKCYEYRPKVCRSFPHLHKEFFTVRLWTVIENYAICPIVFNVYERLKSDIRHYNTDT